MKPACWVDGQPTDALPLSDRGFQYGDGLFETLAVQGGAIHLLDMHLDRLEEGCRRLGLPMPAREMLADEMRASVRGEARAVLKLVLSRGSGGRGYRPPAPVRVRRILMSHPWPEHPVAWREQGVRLRFCSTRLGTNPALAGLKHLNRLEQVLARAEWGEPDEIQEGLMLDEGGRVVEGTMSNLFAVRDGTLVTPDLSRCGIAGVMRRRILEQAQRDGVAVQVAGLSPAELMDSGEIFVCNSIIGVWPVARIDERRYAVGPVTREAQAWAVAA